MLNSASGLSKHEARWDYTGRAREAGPTAQANVWQVGELQQMSVFFFFSTSLLIKNLM